MQYSFDLVGVSPVWQLFNHQQHQGVEYLGTHICTLDAFLESVEPVPVKWGWDLDQVVNTVVEFWMNNAESIYYWKSRLEDAGNENLLVARLAEVHSLQAELEFLLKKNW